MAVFRPSWSDLETLLSGARHTVVVVTPFTTDDGVSRFSKALPPNRPAVRFFTRISAIGWARGNCAPSALAHLLSEYKGPLELIQHSRLHAKLYAVDSTKGLIGSANLTNGGFANNMELVSSLSAADTAAAIAILDAEVTGGKCHKVAAERLAGWVAKHKDLVAEVGKGCDDTDDETSEALADAQRALEGLIPRRRRVRPGSPAARTAATDADYEAFISWIRANRRLPGAAVVLEHFDNRTRQNRTGHVRRSFFAAWLFFQEHPTFAPRLAGDLRRLAPDDVCDLETPGFLDAWLGFFDDHAGDADANARFDVLRGILPPALGGGVVGGGGASGTFRRVFPLVATFLGVRR